MNYKEASSVAREMKRFFEAFARLEEMLLAAADAERAVQESQKTLTKFKIEIAEGQSKVEALAVNYTARKAGFDDKLQQLAANQASTEIAHQQSTKAMNDEFARSARTKKYAHQAKIEALALVLTEKRKRLAEVEAKLHDAEEAYEAMKQKFTG